MIIAICTGANRALYTGWYSQIGLDTGRPPVDVLKRELLEKVGLDFDLDRVRAAINDVRDAGSKRVVDRATLMAEKRARLVKGPNKK